MSGVTFQFEQLKMYKIEKTFQFQKLPRINKDFYFTCWLTAVNFFRITRNPCLLTAVNFLRITLNLRISSLLLSSSQLLLWGPQVLTGKIKLKGRIQIIINKQWLLCISTSFWVLRAPKSWSKHFFQPFFYFFCSIQTFFSDFTPEINKNVWKLTKNVVLSTPQSWLTPLGGTPKLSFFG